MSKVKLLEQFLEEGLFDVVTKSKAFVKNPISATKITNNGKKLAQAEIDNAANDLDYEKRKLASKKAADTKIEAATKKGDSKTAQSIKDEFKDNAQVLAKAHDQKSDALTDKVASIKDRIDDLSKKNATLQDLGSLVKTAARVKRNEVLLKGADEEEKKQLKVQLQKDMEKIDNLQKGFGDYEGAKEPEDKDDKVKDKKEDATVDTGDDKSSKTTGTPPPPPPPPPPSAAPSTKTEPKLTTTSEPKTTTEPQDPAKKLGQARADLSDAQRIRADIRNRIKDYEDKISNLKAGKYDKKKIADPKAELEEIEKQKRKAEERLVDAEEDVKMTAAAAEKAEKELNASKSQAPKQAAESHSSLKSFQDFVNEKKFS